MYGRGYQGSGMQFGPSFTPPIVKNLIIANAVAFVLQSMSPSLGYFGSIQPILVWQGGFDHRRTNGNFGVSQPCRIGGRLLVPVDLARFTKGDHRSKASVSDLVELRNSRLTGDPHPTDSQNRKTARCGLFPRRS